MSTGSVFKRCNCRATVLDEDGTPFLDDKGNPKTRELGSACPKLRRADHGKWYYYLELEARPGGKRRRIRKGAFATKGEAEKELAKAVQQQSKGNALDSRETLSAWLDRWLAGKKKIRPTTHA